MVKSLLVATLLVVNGGLFGAGIRMASAEDLAAGRFLIASRSLVDPNFSETVILLVEYSSEGAMGIIINRPTDVGIDRMVPDLENAEDRPETVWVGGPVAHWQMVLLYRSASELEESQTVVDEVRFSASRTVLESLLTEDAEFRIYAGYAGWAAGQLEYEIERGSWHVLPADPEWIFDPSPFGLWRELITRGEAMWVDWSVPAPGELLIANPPENDGPMVLLSQLPTG